MRVHPIRLRYQQSPTHEQKLNWNKWFTAQLINYIVSGETDLNGYLERMEIREGVYRLECST